MPWPLDPPPGVPELRWTAVRNQAMSYRPTCVAIQWWESWREPLLALVGATAPTRRSAMLGRFRDCIRVIELTGISTDMPIEEMFNQWRLDATISHCRLQGMSPVGIGHVSRNLSALRHAVFGTEKRKPAPREVYLPTFQVLSIAAENGSQRVKDDVESLLTWITDPDPNCALDRAACHRVRHFTRRKGLPRVRMDLIRAERVAYLSQLRIPAVDFPWIHSISWTVMADALRRYQSTPNVSRLDLDGTIPVRSGSGSGLRVVGNMPEINDQDSSASRKLPRTEMRRLMELKSRQFESPAPPLSEEFETVLANPRLKVISARAWEVVGPTVSEVMRRSQYRGREVFVKRLRVVAQYSWWAHLNGYSMEMKVLMAEASIEDWFRRGMPNQAPETRSTNRSNMRAIARAVNPHNNAPVPTGRSAHKDIRPPYTPQEVAQILWLTGHINDKRIQALTATVLVLGLGAGLDSRDLNTLKRQNITDHESAGILISIQGSRPRQVWLLRTFEELLRQALPHLPEKGFLLSTNGISPPSKGFLTSLFKRLNVMDDSMPIVQQARLRATWLTTLMCVPVPLALLLHAAGLESARSITDLFPHARAYTAEEAAVFLRGDYL